MTHPVRVEARVIEHVRDWLRREGPRLDILDRAELTVTIKDSGGVTSDDEMIVTVEMHESSRVIGFYGGLDGIRAGAR